MGATKKWSEKFKEELDLTHIDLYTKAMNYVNLTYMTKYHPNDAELGKAVREYVLEQKLPIKKQVFVEQESNNRRLKKEAKTSAPADRNKRLMIS